MQISLRKAAALQLAINESIKSIKVIVTVGVDQFDDGEAVVARVLESTMANVARRGALTKCLYDIRALVGEANQTSGVNNVLNNMAYIAKQIELATEIVLSSPRMSPTVLAGKLEKSKARTDDVYATAVITGVLEQAHIDTFTKVVQDLKKTKLSLSDQLLTLNVETKITLVPNVVEILKQENLI